jgi:LysR family glycine cleavage system transcriptional activator
MQRWLAPRLADFYQTHPEIDLRISGTNAVVDFATSDFHAAVRFGAGSWSGLRSAKLLDDWIVPVFSPEFLAASPPMKTPEDLKQHNLLFVDDQLWHQWFTAVGGTVIQRNWPSVDDTLTFLIMAEQGNGVALGRWSVVARDLEAGRLVRAIPTAVKTDWSYYFVSPPHYFDLPKVKTLRDWFFEHAGRFEKPE